MKKILFTMMLAMVSIFAMAGSEVKVTEGDKKFFKNAEGTAGVEIVWKGCTFDDKMTLEEKFGSSLDRLKKMALAGFIEDFNNKSKKLQVATSGNVNYVFVITVTKLDQYWNPMGFIPGMTTKMWGTFVVKDGDGNIVLKANIDGVDGGANPNADECFSDCFEELGKQVAKLK